MSSERAHHRFPGTRLVAVFFFAFLYAPILVLVALSFNVNRTASIWTGFTTDWYGEAFADPAIQGALRNSLVIAAVATLVRRCSGCLPPSAPSGPSEGGASCWA